MKHDWRRRDLGGGGLQAANLKLARLLKRRTIAYALLAGFPLGLHRLYLRSAGVAAAYTGATFCAGALALAGYETAALLAGAVLLAAAIRDAVWIDARVTMLNKTIRQSVLLGQAAAPPPGFRGRNSGDVLADYLATKDAEAHASRTAPSAAPIEDAGDRYPTLAEQERALAERGTRNRPPP